MKALVLLCAAISIIYAKNIQLSSSSTVSWTFANGNGSISGNATVPGGVYSDLRRAGVIGDILAGFNDVYTRWVAYDTWTYTAKFKVTENQLIARVIQVVFEGMDTVVFVELNDVPIGVGKNMFVRYVYDVKDHIKPGVNELKVTFISPVEAALYRSERHYTAPECVPSEYSGECHVNQLRKMQASFSWDWGPAFPSVGIWKPVYIEIYNGAIIRSVTTHTTKHGANWQLKVRAHIEAGLEAAEIHGLLSLSLKLEGGHTLKRWQPVNATTMTDGTLEVDIDLPISENMVRLWWPNGYGEQPLYDLSVQLTTERNKDEVSVKYVKIGFRTIKLVQEDAAKLLGNGTDAAKGLTFYFTVNGYSIFMKGSNWIPSNILPELGETDKKVVDDLLLAARDAHMAMLRVWGGGVYESDYFYEKCDELGILIWQDLLFACSMYPTDNGFLQSVRDEIEQNVLRLQHHPSVAVWAGNNENEVALRGNWYHTQHDFARYKREYITLYVDTIRPIVTDLDPGRHYLVSSPSNGVESENEGYIAQNPYDAHYGDTHYYNYLADNWDMNTYPKTRFASEYGFQSLPSLITMKTATNKSKDFALNSSYSQHRQHSPNGYSYITKQIQNRLKLDENDPKHFEKYVFYSQISQAMSIKAETEFYRQSQEDWYTMGALYWQLNDVWQAPSWAGIEYGGRWKMLHYFAKTFFAPVLVSPRLLLSGKVQVYLINDRLVPINDAQIEVQVFNWTSVTPINVKSYSAEVEALTAKMQDIDIDIWENYKQEEVFLRFSLTAPGVKFSPYNYVFPKPLKSIVGLREPTIHITVSNIVMRAPNHGLEYTIDVNVDTVVLFLWLETDADGQFNDNGIVATEPQIRVTFVCQRYIPPQKLQKSITVQYYMN